MPQLREGPISAFPRSSRDERAIGIIPARYGSTRFPGKPLADILGKPMIQWVYERASKAKLLSEVIVATDDERIFQRVKAFGGRAVMTSKEARSGSDRVAEVARGLEAEIIVNIQGDEPLIQPEAIDQAITPLLEDRDILVSTLVKRIDKIQELEDPNAVRVVMDKEGFALYFSRAAIPYSRDLKDREEWIRLHPYYKHIGLYVYRKGFLMEFVRMGESPLERVERLEQLRILENGYKIKVIETDFTSMPVDTPEDLEVVKSYLLRGGLGN